MDKVKVCAYCRVSTKEDEQLTSFQNQIAYFQREFGASEEYELTEIYRDRGTSGTKLSRPGFDKMIKDAGIDKSQIDGDLFLITGKPKFSRILVKNTSRFARNVSADMLLKTLKKNGVCVEFQDTHLSTANDADIMVLQMLQVLDENESRDKSRKVMFGIQEGIKRGNIHSSNNLYGYIYHAKPENRLEIIPEEAEVVRMIFDLYVNKKFGVHRISLYLAEQGIFARSGKRFSECGLRKMIQNETYTGRAVRHKYSNGRIFEKHPLRETGEAVIFETEKVPAIVDMATFEKAQAILESKVQHTAQKGIYKGKTDFAGKLICGCCGEPFYVSGTENVKSAGGRVRYYACRKKRTMHRDAEGNRVMLCDNRNVSERELLGVSGASYVMLLQMRTKEGIKTLEEIRQVLESRIDRQSLDDVEYTQKQLAEVEQKKTKLLDLYMDNLLTKEQYTERREPLDAEAEDLKEKIRSLSKSNEDIQQDIAEVEETISYLRTLDTDCRNRLTNSKVYPLPTTAEVMDDIESIIVEPEGGLTFKLKAYEQIDKLLAKHRHLMEFVSVKAS